MVLKAFMRTSVCRKAVFHLYGSVTSVITLHALQLRKQMFLAIWWICISCFPEYSEFKKKNKKNSCNFQKSIIIIYFHKTLSFRTEQKGMFMKPQCLIILMSWLSQNLRFIKGSCRCFVEVSSPFLRNCKRQWRWTRSSKQGAVVSLKANNLLI